MTFIVILTALLIERFFDWSHLRSFGWYQSYQKLIKQRLPHQESFVVLAVIIVPIVVGILTLQYLLLNSLYGLVEVFFQLFILLYCLGPRNLWADIFASINIMTENDREEAIEKLQSLFATNLSSQPHFPLQNYFIQQVFLAANRRIFAPIFWFMIFGPIGAVFYRFISLTVCSTKDLELSLSAKKIESILDWLPARIFTFLLALSGHFVQLFTCWRKKVFLGLDQTENLVMECGRAALDMENTEISQGDILEKNASHLLDRTFIIMMVFILLFNLI